VGQKNPREDKNILDQHPDIAEMMKKELLMWFKDIKNSEFTFTSPQFRIGYKGESKSFIWACGPNKVTGNVKNRNHIIEGWRESGDTAFYDLQINRQERISFMLK